MKTSRPAPRRAIGAGALFLLLALFACGCTETFYVHGAPPPANKYGAATRNEPATFAIADKRTPDRLPLSAGTHKIELQGMGNGIPYLADNLVNVLHAEGIEVKYVGVENAPLELAVLTYRIRNLQSSGFSPVHTFTTFAGNLSVDAGTPRRVTAYFKNTKVPVWSSSELVRPCFQIPFEVIVKEIAAKMNAQVFGRVTPTEKVNELAAAVPTAPSDTASEAYLKVLELGYTNNPAAIPPLVKLTERRETMMRAAAVSALGILGAKEQLPLLEKIYAENSGYVKSMAVKSIGTSTHPSRAPF